MGHNDHDMQPPLTGIPLPDRDSNPLPAPQTIGDMFTPEQLEVLRGKAEEAGLKRGDSFSYTGQEAHPSNKPQPKRATRKVPKTAKAQSEPRYFECGYKRPKQDDLFKHETCAFVTTSISALRNHAILEAPTAEHANHARRQYERFTGNLVRATEAPTSSGPTPIPPSPAAEDDVMRLDHIIHGEDELKSALDQLGRVNFPSARDLYLKSRDDLYNLLRITQDLPKPDQPKITAEIDYLTKRLEAAILLRKTEDGPTNRRGHFTPAPDHNFD